MDDQGLRRRLVCGFQRVPYEDIDMFVRQWLQPQPGVEKPDYKLMMANIRNGSWSLWRLPPPAEGILVSYPENDLVFIYYLRGKGFFGRLNHEDFLEAVRAEGAVGVGAWTQTRANCRLLERQGFKVTNPGEFPYKMELRPWPADQVEEAGAAGGRQVVRPAGVAAG